MKKLILIVMLVICYNCHKKESIGLSSERSLKDKLYNKIDKFIDSSNCEKNRIIEIRHQKYKGKDFLQISTAKIFMPDSLYVLTPYKSDYLLAFYNKEYFKKFIRQDSLKNKETMESNKQFNFNKINYTETGIPCHDMYILTNKKIEKVSQNSYYYNNLFASPPLLPPPPPPTK
jgi:hypothetical protein